VIVDCQITLQLCNASITQYKLYWCNSSYFQNRY
jgi:hypothetical protein